MRLRFSSHRGVTLLEVMLVLAVMVIIASLVWPSLSRAFSNQRLKYAADLIRTQWGKARVKAMQENRVVLFRYESNGRRFRLDSLAENAASDSSETEPTEQVAQGTTSNESNTPSTGQSNGSPHTVPSIADHDQSLPVGITFATCEINTDSRSQSVGESVLPTSSDTNWSSPIYFFPDGTTSDVRMRIGNDQQRIIDLTLRGMTGVVKVSDVKSEGGGS